MAKDQNVSVDELLKSKEVRKKIDLKKYITAEVGFAYLAGYFKRAGKTRQRSA
jgi:hypothetical protein